MKFDSDELLRAFGNDHFETEGKWCRVSHSCFDCDLVWSCEPALRRHYIENETKKDTENEPCGSDYPLRQIHHGWALRKYAFKKYSHDKGWHDNQPEIIPMEACE